MEEDFYEKSKQAEASMNINLQKHPDVLNETIKNATVIFFIIFPVALSTLK